MLYLLVLIVCAAASPAPRSIPTAALSNGWHIIGGDDVSTPGKWPWQCSLQVYGSHICGCSYLGNDWVMTAAHCVNGQSTYFMNIVVGAHDLHSQSQGSYQSIGVERTTMHEKYNDGTAFSSNDVALIKLSQVPTQSKFVAAVKLAPNDGETYVDRDCVITGWGSDGRVNTPNILQEASISALSTSHCIHIWGPANINDNVICLRDCPSKDTGAYRGDSGGPAQCKKDGEWIQVGITSWGEANGNPYYPSVYTRVSSYYDWVMKTSNNLS